MILPGCRCSTRPSATWPQRHGAILVDLWHDEEFHNPQLWSEDRLHLASIGHHRVAAHVLRALGIDPDPTWWDLPDPAPRRSWPAARAHDVRWAAQHLAPWVKRRLDRAFERRHGDTPKRPTSRPVRLTRASAASQRRRAVAHRGVPTSSHLWQQDRRMDGRTTDDGCWLARRRRDRRWCGCRPRAGAPGRARARRRRWTPPTGTVCGRSSR